MLTQIILDLRQYYKQILTDLIVDEETYFRELSDKPGSMYYLHVKGNWNSTWHASSELAYNDDDDDQLDEEQQQKEGLTQEVAAATTITTNEVF